MMPQPTSNKHATQSPPETATASGAQSYATSRLPDLVRDSRLETRFRKKYIIHHFLESDDTRGERVSFREEYWKNERLIGGGSYGKVWLQNCIRGAKDYSVRAVKQIQKPQQSREHVDCNRELEAIAKFSHERYVRCFVKSTGWFEDEHNLYIAMEHLPHGDLHKHMSGSDPLVEPEVQTITYQLLEGLDFLHKNSFAHRDLKPSNILIKSKPPEPWWIKIGDFGISKRVEDSTGRLSTIRGTLGFMPPEVHGFVKEEDRLGNGSAAAQAADIWALGEISFQLLTKQAAFANMAHLFEFVQNPDVFPATILQQRAVNQTCIDLLRSMLLPFPSRRMRVEEALLHPWISVLRIQTHRAASVTSLSSSDTDNVSQFADTFDHSEPSASWTTVSQHPNFQSISMTSAFASSKQHETLLSEAESPRTSQLKVTAVHATSNDPFTQYSSRMKAETAETSPSRHEGLSEGLQSTLDGVLDQQDHPAISVPCGQEILTDDSSKSTAIVYVVKFSPDGSLLASGTSDAIVRLWYVKSNQELHTLRAHKETIRDIAFSPDGSLLASASNDKTIRLWQVSTGEQVQILRGHTDLITAIAFSLDGSLLVSGAWDYTIRLWQLEMGQKVQNCLWPLSVNPQAQELKDYTSFIYEISFSPQGLLLTASRKRMIVWDIKSSEKPVKLWVRDLDYHYSIERMFLPACNGAFSPDCALLQLDWKETYPCVRVENARTGVVIRTFELGMPSDRQACRVAVSSDNSLLAISIKRDVILIYEIQPGRKVLELVLNGDFISFMAISPDNSLLGVGSWNGTVRLFQVRTGREVWARIGHLYFS